MGLRTRRASARSRPRTVTERDLAVVCPFSERWLLLHGYGLGGAGTLVRHDLRTGREVEIAPHVGQFAVSPDGTRVAYVAGLDYHGLGPKGHGTLELVDVNTLQHRQLAGPLAGAGSAGFVRREEVASSRKTERGTRADDKRSETAMEDRKKAGYF